jgi:hypothetical protein
MNGPPGVSRVVAIEAPHAMPAGTRFLIAIQWTCATTAALVAADLLVEILGAAVLGFYLIFLLPMVGGVLVGLPVGVFQWLVLRRHFANGGSWIGFTLLGFGVAWVLAMVLAAVLFVAPSGSSGVRGLLSLAIPTPIIGLSQAVVLRRWGLPTRWWVLASTVGWSGLLAVELFGNKTLATIDQLAGQLVSGIAGYSVASSVGATLLGGAFAGAATGTALAMLLRGRPKPVGETPA